MKLKIVKFKSVRSTNDEAIKIIKSGQFFQGLVSTDTQANGRGTMGKKWISCKGNIFISIFFKVNLIKIKIENYLIINAKIIKKILRNYTKKNIVIKKPNDLLIKNNKVSGILQETLCKSGEIFIIVGIGVNLIKSPIIKNYLTTNLLDLTGIKITPNNAALKLKKIYEKFIPMFAKFNVKNINRI